MWSMDPAAALTKRDHARRKGGVHLYARSKRSEVGGWKEEEEEV